MLSIAVFSAKHKHNNISEPFSNKEISYIYENQDGKAIECTAIFIPEMFWRDGYSEMNQETVKDYVTRHKYYLYPDMEYRGIVTKWLKTNKS